MTGSRASATAGAGGLAPGVVEDKRSSIRLVTGMIRNPVETLPAACFDARMVLTRNLGRLRAYLVDPALIHEVLVGKADSLTKSESTKRVLGAALGDGLLTSDGPTWRRQRQAIAPAFRHERLTGLLPAMIAAAERTRDDWLSGPPGRVVDVGHHMMHTTFAIILDTMLSGSEGIEAAEIERRVDDYLGATSWMFALAILKAPRWVPFPGRRRALAATLFMRAAVRARVATRRHAATRPDDLMGMLLAASDPDTGRVMTDEEICDNILTFIAAGHETTAVALTWTLALLADRPDCEARLLAEIDEVTGGGPVLPDHVAKLGYAGRIVSEAMRLYPPAPIIVRTTHREIEVAGSTLPSGSLVVVPIYALHRHRGLWERPETFDPDRFAPDAARGRHRFAYLPFGAGPRTCVGSAFAMMEAVAILAVLVKALRVERVDAELPKPIMRVTLRPDRPLRLRVTRR